MGVRGLEGQERDMGSLRQGIAEEENACEGCGCA